MTPPCVFLVAVLAPPVSPKFTLGVVAGGVVVVDGVVAGVLLGVVVFCEVILDIHADTADTGGCWVVDTDGICGDGTVGTVVEVEGVDIPLLFLIACILDDNAIAIV